MLILLKLASITIWFIIMIFIIGGVFRRRRASIRDLNRYFINKTKNEPKLCSDREKV